jgi:triacylglycerol esterase/lipase EstA (alpha/beta hydrolase family)
MTRNARVFELVLVVPTCRNRLIAMLGLVTLLLAACGDVASQGWVTDPEGSRGHAPKDTPGTGDGSTGEVCVPKSCPGIALRENRAQHPIVLIHGMGGFVDLGSINYFNGIQEHLRAKGYAIYSPVMDPMNGSDVRGKQLAAFLDQLFECTCATKVNLIGHSQGGIDARYVVNVLG